MKLPGLYLLSFNQTIFILKINQVPLQDLQTQTVHENLAEQTGMVPLVIHLTYSTNNKNEKHSTH